MLIGQMLAYAGMDEGKEVTWLPSYGPEMRGGTAYCTVVISDEPISSPVISNPEMVVVMNRPSLEKFGPTVRRGGFIFINSSLVHITSGRNDIEELFVPCNELAAEAGNPKSANIVMMGALVERTGIVSAKSVSERIGFAFSQKGKDVVKANTVAFEKGLECVKYERKKESKNNS